MDLRSIKGIGPKKEEKLKEMGIDEPIKLITYLPNYYENRSNKISLANSMGIDKEYFELEILSPLRTYFPRRNMTISRLKAKDSTGELNLIWYNDRFSPQSLEVGRTYKFFGRYDKDKKSMSNPIFSKLDDDYIGGIYPIYSVIKGLSKKDFIRFKDHLFEQIDSIDDYFDNEILEKYKILSLYETYNILHKPRDYFQLYSAKKSYIIRQAVLDGLATKLLEEEDSSFISFKDIELEEDIKSLNFNLTNGQKLALHEIVSDMIGQKKMNRLLIGDVGSGKTIVSVLAGLLAVKNSYQVAFMAPTELLAYQHYKNYQEFFEERDIKIALLLGSTNQKEKEEIYEGLEDGSIKFLFGTHALFQDRVKYKNLGLVITDEQQRFGVYQRRLLSDKGKSPDNLLLSATPIPRTLALTIYKDLDLSIIEGLPTNRKPIESYLVNMSYEKRFMDFAQKQVDNGRQVYVVCSRVLYDEEIDINSVEAVFKRYKKYFKNKAEVDFLHGQLDAQEKIEKQAKFVEGKTDILIATSIVEVGIDVKNANLMIIYNANNFGLSQLHQLRGRVGRGDHQSYCIFVSSSLDLEDEKLKFIESNNNGFELAKKDMELRGTGDRLGLYQSGFSEEKVFDIYDGDFYDNVNDLVDDIINESHIDNNKLLKDQINKKIEEYKKIILN